ncbi:MAG: hypothetical protein EU532_12005 [Promethearchaeota archaeon]|nr:MAG: hypothetical protein EU532_12005 [Candidatus Lokiarchaeota archaeon]
MVTIIKEFIDFDKNNDIIYDNLYLEDEKIVIKTPIIKKDDIYKCIKNGFKIERFNLTNYTFLLTVE